MLYFVKKNIKNIKINIRYYNYIYKKYFTRHPKIIFLPLFIFQKKLILEFFLGIIVFNLLSHKIMRLFFLKSCFQKK